MIAHGFTKETTEEDVIKKVTEIVHTNGFDKGQIKEIFTFTDPSAIGVIHFLRKVDVTTFLRRMRDKDIDMGDGKHMSFSSNESLEQRTSDKPLGFIKYHLKEQLEIPLKNIRINRKFRTVKIPGRVVAKPGGGTEGVWVDFLGRGIAGEIAGEGFDDNMA